MALSLRETTDYAIAHPWESIQAAIGVVGIRPGSHLLDVGCGPGAHLGLFLAAIGAGGRVTGCDADAERLAVAADIWHEAVAQGTLALQTGDMQALPYADATFDVTWCSLVLHHAQDPDQLLAEMARVTRPGGTVAILDGDAGLSFPVAPWP
ncbi:MAG: methyltransferase domain-containing protein, partial [Ktedonobacterales bacterium]|nr:methyltransferase domain-containing protein [Ktedonobacterales bacterium]